MKRLPVVPRGSLHRLLAILGVLAASASLVLMLAGCAGAAQARRSVLSPEQIARAFDEAGEQLTLGTPEALEACALRMDQEGLPEPEATQLAALAGRLFRLLYPEVDVPSVFPVAGAYGGPYLEALTAAARGAPPPAHGSAPAVPAEPTPAKPGRREAGAAEGTSVLPPTGFLDKVVPALYLARLESWAGTDSGSSAEPPGLVAGLEGARAENPRSVVPPYLLARAAELSGRVPAAIELYQGCLTLSQSFYPARRRLAALYLEQGKAASAVTELERLRTELPAEPGVRDSLIQAYLAAAEPDKASVLVAEALIDQPDGRTYLYLRAGILLAQGNWTQALKPLALLLLHHPDAREGYLLTARIHYERAQDIERALEVIREAEKRFPAEAEFPEAAGSLLIAEGRSDEGFEQLRRALELEPGRLTALRLMVGEAMRLQRWIQAGRYLEEVLARETTAGDLRDAYIVADHLGDRTLASSYAEKLYRLDPSDQTRLLYASALLSAGLREEARSLIEQELGAAAEPAVRSSLLFLQARLQEDQDPDGALRILQRALIQDPGNEPAVRRLAELYLRRGQLREARLFFRTAVQHNPGDAGLKLQLEQVEQALEGMGGEE